MILFFGIVLMVVWCLVVVALGVAAMTAWDDHGPKRGLVVSACAIVVFAAPIAYVGSRSNDPYASTLCLRGHQEWQSYTRPTAIVGKVIIPGGTSSRKAWICDQWEAR